MSSSKAWRSTKLSDGIPRRSFSCTSDFGIACIRLFYAFPPQGYLAQQQQRPNFSRRQYFRRCKFHFFLHQPPSLTIELRLIHENVDQALIETTGQTTEADSLADTEIQIVQVVFQTEDLQT